MYKFFYDCMLTFKTSRHRQVTAKCRHTFPRSSIRLITINVRSSSNLGFMASLNSIGVCSSKERVQIQSILKLHPDQIIYRLVHDYWWCWHYMATSSYHYKFIFKWCMWRCHRLIVYACTCTKFNKWTFCLFSGGYSGTSSENKAISSKNEISNHPQKDLWFKAAVIAVPIAGGFILVLLVLLAVRMLRTDSRYHRRLIQIRRERSLTKAQLYVTDHFLDKSDKQNTVYSETHCHKNTSPPKVTIHNGNTYEQVNTDKNENTDKSVNTETVPNAQIHHQPMPHLPYSSYIVWGKPKNNDFATVV